MAKDLRSFIELLKQQAPEEIIEINKPVDRDLEVTAIIGRLEKDRRYPLLHFKHIKGFDMPLVANVYCRYKKIALAMGVNEDNLFDEYLKRKAHPILPKEVSDGPCKENILTGDKIDVTKLPVPKISPEDDAPYFGTPVTIAKDIDNPAFPLYNLGIYRHRVIDKKKIGLYYSWGKYFHYLHKKAEDRGKPFEVALAIGLHPAICISSMDQNHMHEFELAGALMDEPVELVKCETVDLHVPAQSEIVIEGVMQPGARQREGPFGEYPGYYGHIVDAPYVDITCITHRNNPIYQHASSGKHAENVFFLGWEADMLSTLRRYYPTITKIHMPFHVAPYFCFIAMKKLNEGDAISAGVAAAGLQPLVKYAIVVDHDVNVYDERDVLWAVSTRARPDEDFVTIPRAKGNRLDPSTYTRMKTSRDSMVTKLVIDATVKTGIPYELPEPIREPMIDTIRLKDYGINEF